MDTHCKEGHGPHTWYLCPGCPYQNRFLPGIREHISKKHDVVAKAWGSNLEGRKIDKSRFITSEQHSPQSVLANHQLSKMPPNHSFNLCGLANVAKSTVDGEIKEQKDCIVISDDEDSQG